MTEIPLTEMAALQLAPLRLPSSAIVLRAVAILASNIALTALATPPVQPVTPSQPGTLPACHVKLTA